MAYERKEQILLPGGLNLLAASDLVSGRDSIALKNFRSDGSGVLRTNFKADAATVALTIPAQPHTAFREGATRWFAAGTKLYRGTTVVKHPLGADIALDGTPVALIGYHRYLYVMNRSDQGVVRDVGGLPVMYEWLAGAPGSPTLGAQAGGSLVDDISYVYVTTFVQDDGTETNPGDESTLAPVAGSGNNTIRVTRTAAIDARTTHWNVYRRGNTVGTFYRVNTAPIVVASTTFDDTGAGDYDDTEITRQGIALETDHDAAPFAAWMVGPYYGRFICGNGWVSVTGSGTVFKNRIWWTKAGQINYWPAENYADIGDADDEGVNATIHQGHLRIYTKRSVWRLRGDPGNGGTLERTNAEVGLIGMKALDSVGHIDYFQAQEGIYAFDGDQAKKISGKIDPLFRAELTMPAGADPDLARLNGDETYRAKNCLAVKNGRLYFCYTDSAATAPNQGLTCNLETGDWTPFWIINASPQTSPAAFTALHYEGQYGELLGAGPLGIIYALEYPLPDTNPVPLRWTSGFVQPGAREQQTRWADLVVEHSVARSKAADRNLTLKLKLDHTDTSDLSVGSLAVATTAAGAARLTSVFPFGTSSRGVTARSAAIMAEGDCEHEVSIYSATLHYFLEPRDAKTFDSGNTDCGVPFVKLFDWLELSIFNRGTVTYDVLTELPSGALASRQTSTFTLNTDRTPVQIPLAGCDGRLIRVQLTSPEIFWLYSARLRYRIQGLYLTASQVWSTSNQAIGV